ncbi:hypothetical protein, partial [Thermoflexibacter ruber]
GGARLMPILLFADLLTLTTNGGKNDASVRNHERFEQEQYENYLSRQAGDSKEERDNYTYFFTVQSNEDTDRLRTTGYPFPTEPNKSALGEGVYAWGTLAAAHLYRQNLISRYGESVIEKTIILAFRIKTNILNSLRQLDIDSLTNPEEWLSKYSKLWGGIPNHGLQYIIRGTGEAMRGAKEHFFHHTIFSFLKFF